MSLFQVQGVNKYFEVPTRFHALKDISFDVERGEFLSIMGKSGCGKSTLLYILSTMDRAYEGNIIFDGQNLSKMSTQELTVLRNRDIGFVFQFHYLLPEFTVLENVMMPAWKLGQLSDAEIRKNAMEQLDMLGIADQADKLATRISGGQKQRVAIARALINKPKIIMGDEPTGNLDSKNSANVFSVFRSLSHEHGLSLIVVTHDTDFAARTDRIITMGDGAILDDG